MLPAVVLPSNVASGAQSSCAGPLRTQRWWCSAALLATLSAASTAHAFPSKLDAFRQRYGAISASADNANCQLCHAEANAGVPWNAYGWAMLQAASNATCDLDQSGGVSDAEALFCIESADSDHDASGTDNLTEISLSAQPGWALGSSNTLYTRTGTISGVSAPSNLGSLDPDGTEPVPPELPPPPAAETPREPRYVQHVHPGESIQAAIDRARPGGYIFVYPGTYRELADPVNGLRITQSGLNLIGLSSERGRVVLENAGNQRNGIVVVPADRTQCMSCHADMAPPFSLLPGADAGAMKSTAPKIHGLLISGITIKNFVNNGLFTENVERFAIVDVESVGNKNYGIFPTLSRDGLITHSKASGADDSGIWVETSENVLVTHNLAEGNVNGFEISNSKRIVLKHNVARGNSVGLASFLLPDLFDERPEAVGYVIRNNRFVDNNKPNTARPGSILATAPVGTGILHVGADAALFEKNHITGNQFVGLSISDYCLGVVGTPFDCSVDPTVPPGFVAASEATGNRVIDNVITGNGLAPDPSHPFAQYAGDIALLTAGDHGNCYRGNTFETSFSTLGALPECPSP